MTKRRAPVTFERALVRVADLIGWPAMGEAIGKAPRTVLDYSDPDTDTGISLRDAFALDLAFRRAGGEGAPLHDCWRLRLELEEHGAPGCRDALFRHTVSVIKESGEAAAALVHATAPGATLADRALARRELEESISAQTRTLAHLDEGAGPDELRERADPGGAC